MLFDQTYSNMARRRLKIFTACVLLLIVLLTLTARMMEEDKQHSPLPKRFYVRPTVTNYRRTPDASQDLHQERKLNVKFQWSYVSDSPRLTRYGANLQFDHLSLCPKDSLMLSDWKQIRTKTHRCPQVFIIGAKKGGTTSLYQYLSKHPDFEGIRLNESKWIGETFYFAQTYTSLRLSEYVRLFPMGKMSGDASVDNLLFCKSPERILKTCGSKTKIIILLRDPIKRYISNFMMRVQRPQYSSYNNYTSISETTKNEYHVLKAKLDQQKLNLPQNESDWVDFRCLFSCCTSMIYEGMYYVFIMNWLCNFPKENIIFINSEEFFTYPVDIFKEILTFLGLKPLAEETIKHITSVVYNEGPTTHEVQHQLKEEDLQTLNSIYRPFNEGLLKLLNWSVWL